MAKPLQHLRRCVEICKIGMRAMSRVCQVETERSNVFDARLNGVQNPPFQIQSAGKKDESLYKPWKILKMVEEEDVIEAQSLLFQVYIKEMRWMFAKGNPTGFRIETSKCGRKLLTDDREHHSTWFGVTHNERLVAAMRMVGRDHEGHLDLTRYDSSKNPEIQRLISPEVNPSLFELQRCAIVKEYRGTNVMPCLFHFLFLDSAMKNCGMIGTSPVGKMKSFLQSTLKFRIVDQNFLYSENMEGPSTVFFATAEDQYRAATILEGKIKQTRHLTPC